MGRIPAATLLMTIVAIAGCRDDRAKQIAPKSDVSIGTAQVDNSAAAPVEDAAKQTAAGSGAQCRSAERSVYTCQFGEKALAVCANKDGAIYRYGTRAKAELEILATPENGKGFVGSVVGGGGGQQRSIRFVNGGLDYIVYTASPGRYHDIDKSWSGLTVYRGSDVVLEKRCSHTGAAQSLAIDQIDPPLPSDEKDIGWQ